MFTWFSLVLLICIVIYGGLCRHMVSTAMDIPAGCCICECHTLAYWIYFSTEVQAKLALSWLHDKSKANKTIHCIHNNNITLCFYNLQVQGYDCHNDVYPSVIEIVLYSPAGAREIKMNSDFLENLVCPCYKIYKAEGVNLLGYSIFYKKKNK